MRNCVVDYIIDASAIINLHNADALELLGCLGARRFWITPIVLGECEPSCSKELAKEISSNRIECISDGDLNAERFLALLDEHSLGLGETESIIACKTLGFGFCCDDKQARNLAKAVLGDSLVVGTIRVLRWCGKDKVIGCKEAFGLFGVMQACGGFLPKNTTRGNFCAI